MAVLFVVSPESAGSVGRTIHSVPTTGFEKCICTIRHRPSRFSSTPVQRALVHEANAISLTPDVEAETTAKFVAPHPTLQSGGAGLQSIANLSPRRLLLG